VEGVNVAPIAETQPGNRVFWRVVRRLLLYVGLAFASLTVFALFFALTIRLGITKDVQHWFDAGWVGLLVYTGLLFWITVRESRRRWRHWSFWLAIACLLTIHSLAFVAILRIYPDWRVIWFWPVTVVEAGVFGGMLAWLFPERRARVTGDTRL
jgi:cytochrome bd-type quinol oxidase subunit 2